MESNFGLERQRRSLIPSQALRFEPLVKWIIEQSLTNGLETKTIELAVLYTHKYLLAYDICEEYLPLLGIVSLLVACKFNECQERINITLDDCIQLMNGKVDQDDVCHMEDYILQLIEYNANQETISDSVDDSQRNFILFITLETAFSHYTRKELACAMQIYLKKDTSSNKIVSEILLKLDDHFEQTSDDTVTSYSIRKTIKKPKRK